MNQTKPHITYRSGLYWWNAPGFLPASGTTAKGAWLNWKFNAAVRHAMKVAR